MEILHGPFGTNAEILALINNVSVRPALRRFAPQRHAVFVDRQGRVVMIVRSKENVSVGELSVIRDKECPDTCFFLVWSGLYASEAEFNGRIDDCVQAFAIAPSSAGMEERVIDGKRVLIIGAGPRKNLGDKSH